MSTVERRNKYIVYVNWNGTGGDGDLVIDLDTISGAVTNWPQTGRSIMVYAGPSISPSNRIQIVASSADADEFRPAPIDAPILLLDEPHQVAEFHSVGFEEIVSGEPVTRKHWQVIRFQQPHRSAAYIIAIS